VISESIYFFTDITNYSLMSENGLAYWYQYLI